MKNLTTRSVRHSRSRRYGLEFIRCLRRFVDHIRPPLFRVPVALRRKALEIQLANRATQLQHLGADCDGIDFAVGEHFVDPSGTPFNEKRVLTLDCEGSDRHHQSRT